jgi:hypothetical protein
MQSQLPVLAAGIQLRRDRYDHAQVSREDWSAQD